MSFDLILPFLRPIEGLLLDENLSEIMGNPDSSWWFERDGILHSAAHVSFSSAGLRTGLEVVANKLGKKLDEDNPVLNAQLPAVWQQSFPCGTARSSDGDSQVL